MARRLKDDYNFGGTRGRHDLYPWDEWLDGSVWRIRRGEDFEVSIVAIRSAVHQAAARRGHKVETATEDEDTLVLRAYDGGEK